MTMIAIKNPQDVVEASVPGLAGIARITVEECEAALEKMKSPDPYSRTKEFEGRRIQEVDGGWLLLNGEKYRRKMNQDERREYNRVKQQEHRDKAKERRPARKVEEPRAVALPKEAAFWNLNRGGLAEVQSCSSGRLRHLSARRADAYWVANYEAAVLRLGKSDFCNGKNERGWRADFGWVIERPDTVAKIMEGKYDNRKQTSGRGTAGNPRNVTICKTVGPTITEVLARREKEHEGENEKPMA